MTFRRPSRLILAVFAALAASVAAGCSSSGEARSGTHGAPERVSLPVPPGATQVGVASIANGAGHWYAAGSFHDSEGEHRPGLWTSTDAEEWTRIETVPVTYYGTVSELYSVAATADGVVAIGAATGGFHANPRIVSWTLSDDGMLHEVHANFELYNGIRQMTVRSVTRGPAGWVIIGSRVNQNGQIGATSWTSATGDGFAIHDDDPALSSSVTQLTFGSDVAQVGDQLVAVGERTTYGDSAGETDGIAWTSADGSTWQPWSPDGLDLGGPGMQRLNKIASDGSRTMIAGTQSDGKPTTITAWTTIDGDVWRRVTVTPFGVSDDVLSQATAIAVTPDEFVLAARSGGVLHLAVSTDGDTWRELHVADDLPTGNRAVMGVATDGDTLLIGATSLDGGGLWRSART